MSDVITIHRMASRRTATALLALVALVASLACALRAAPEAQATPTSPEPASAVRSFTGMTSLPATDDGSSASQPIGFPIDFYGTSYSSLYVNNNGNLTFSAPLTAYTPFNLDTTNTKIIAPFFADVDTRTGKTATYGQTTVDGHPAFAATWPGVGCYNNNNSVLDDFQVVLISRSDIAPGDFDIEFDYNRVQWDIGQASLTAGTPGFTTCTGSSTTVGSARVGYSSGTAPSSTGPSTSYELPGSGVSGAFLDGGASSLTGHSLNSSVPGRYVFNVRAGTPATVTSVAGTLTSSSGSGASVSTTPGDTVYETALLSGQTSTAGGTVTYGVYSDSACTTVLSSDTVTVTNGVVPASPKRTYNTGTYYWKASYSGDVANGGSVTGCGANVLTVAPLPVTVTAVNQAITYGAALPPFTYSVSAPAGFAFTTPPTCQTTGTGAAGSFPVTCSGGSAGAKYAISYVSGQLTVAPAPLVITATDAQRTYGQSDPAFTYTVAGLQNGDQLSTAPSCAVAAANDTPSGRYTINCAGANAGPNYSIVYKSGTLTVNPAQVQITPADASIVYGAAEPQYAFTVSGLLGNDQLITQPTCSVATPHVHVGTYSIACSGADAGANYAITYTTGRLTVTQAPGVVTANSYSNVYGQPDPSFGFTVSGLRQGDSLASSPTCGVSGQHTDVGVYPIVCTGGSGGNDYSLTYQAGTLTVTPAPLTVTANGGSAIYDGTTHGFGYTVTGLIGTDGVTTAPSCGVSGRDVGSYQVTCSGASAGADYVISYVAATVNITPATLNVSANNQQLVYGSAEPAYTYSVTGLVGADTLTTSATCTAAPHPHVGSYPITCSGASAGPDYTVSYSPGLLTVTPATVTVRAADAQRSYGAADPAFGYTASGLVGSDQFRTAPTCGVVPAHSAVGSYPIVCSGADAGGDYQLTYLPGTLTVTPAAVVITASAASTTYGAGDPFYGYTTSGLIGADQLTTTPTCAVVPAHSAVGTYPITCAGGNAGTNYSISYVPGTLTVARAVLTVTAPSPTVTYGTPAGAVSLAAGITGLVNGDSAASSGLGTPGCTTSATATAGGSYPAGSYQVVCTGAAQLANYTVNYVPGTLTVTKATLTVTANSVSRTYGSANPAFTSSVTGFVNGDTPAAAYSGSPAVSSAATPASHAGTYPISVSAGTLAASNYTFVFVPGTLTVTRAGTNLAPGAALVSLTPIVLNARLGTLTARLTYGSGTPAVAQVLQFSVHGTALCTATTDATGTATCRISPPQELLVILNLGYSVTFAGSQDLLPASAAGTLITFF